MIRVLIRNDPGRRYLRMYYVDPESGREIKRSAKTTVVREAERKAAAWEAELLAGRGGEVVGWDVFRARVESEYLGGRPKSTAASYRKALNSFERLIGKPRQMTTVDASCISRFTWKLREGVGPTTVNSTLKHFKTLLRWGARMGMLHHAPTFEMPRMPPRRLARSRAVTPAEFERVIEAVPKVVGDAAAEWVRLLHGIFLSGMRISEALLASWNEAPIRVNLDATPPRIYWFSEGHKARKDQVIPLTPDFAQFLSRTPKESRVGPVFSPQIPGRTMDVFVASRTISQIGRVSGVVVGDDGKHASAHDLRRSFGHRWSLKVPPLVLKTLMRHKTIDTTMSYYVDLDLNDVAPFLWPTGEKR